MSSKLAGWRYDNRISLKPIYMYIYIFIYSSPTNHYNPYGHWFEVRRFIRGGGVRSQLSHSMEGRM